jgi:RimJ/RimL family protein N-acetyltransferase
MNDVTLREMTPDDIPHFFRHQLDADANYMAGFGSDDPTDHLAFVNRWMKIITDETVIKKTVFFGDEIAGHVLHFEQLGKPAVAYWTGREYWGKGITTRALAAFLHLIETRPLYARVLKDNIGSFRVLEKCGFVICGEDKAFAPTRQAEFEEYIMMLK